MEVDEIQIVPNHIVEITIEKLLKTKNERIRVGKSEFVRVTICGLIASIEENECDVAVDLEDVGRQNRVTATKIFTASWTRDRVAELRIGDFATVHGKVRTADGHIFLNALAIQKASKAEYEARESMAKLAEIYYETNAAAIENGTSTKMGTKIGMTNKKTCLDRFPIGMLEESTSQENNGGVWPRELEELAGISMKTSNGNVKEEPEDEDDDDDDESEEEEEEEDSFDQPLQNATIHVVENGNAKEKQVKEEEQEEFDSFDAIQ